jgi:D-alanyl-D-alanine carboxypeptidase
MLATMSDEGIPARVQSAFRGFGTQCWVFAAWAQKARGGFCEATEQSALPGHSQHQLGTTLDLFTKEWAEEGAKTGQGVFRNGFGCTRGGQWLDETAWKFGFVVSYPIHPDDRKDGSRCVVRADRSVPVDPKTGYKNEPWHLRFIGVEAAATFHEAWLASVPGSPDEITLEQWLRTERGLVGDAELPVCDGCHCGACTTLATGDAKTPCGDASLELDGEGRVLGPTEEPRLIGARATRAMRVTDSARDGTVAIEATVHVPPHTPTQTPIIGPDGPSYANGATFTAVMPYPDLPPHKYPDLPEAFRLAAEPSPPPANRWPWRASLASPELASTWNRANIVLPAKAGDITVRVLVDVPPGTQSVRVTLVRNGAEHGTTEVPIL